MHIFQKFASKMAASDLVILMTLNKLKFLVVIFADFEHVKNFSTHFADLNKSKH